MNDVIKNIKQLSFRLPDELSGLDGKNRAVMLDDIIDILNNFERKWPKLGKWIPCSERLPSEEEVRMPKDETGYTELNYFIVQVKGAELPTIAYCIDGTFEPCDYDERFADEIIAWQPLPEPYKEE